MKKALFAFAAIVALVIGAEVSGFGKAGIEAATPLPSGCYTDAQGLPVCGPNYPGPGGGAANLVPGICTSPRSSPPPAGATAVDYICPTPGPQATPSPTASTGITITGSWPYVFSAGGGGISDATYDAVIEAEASLVAYYPTEETSGTTFTDVKGTNNGTYSGGFTLRAGLVNGLHGVAFNGSTGIASAAEGVTVTNFTIECIYLNGSQASTLGNVGCDNYSSSSPAGGVEAIPNNSISTLKVFYNGSGGAGNDTSTSFGLTFYQPILTDYTYDGTNIRIYFNGILVNTVAETVGGSSVVEMNRAPSACLCIYGKAALYNAALTQSDIMTHAIAAGL